jgi:hypothetical protein
MRVACGLAFALTALTLGSCAASKGVTPYALQERVEFTFSAQVKRTNLVSPTMTQNRVEATTTADVTAPERHAWLIGHCVPMGSESGPGMPFAHHANVIEISQQPSYGQAFACPEPPPWPRDDGDRNEFLRKPPANLTAALTCPAGQSQSASVTRLRTGNGASVAANAFVRVLARQTETKLVKDELIYHGRPSGGAYEVLRLNRESRYTEPGATRIAQGTRLPVSEPALVYTMHISCFGECISSALPQLRQGDQAKVACDSESWEVEVLAVGGQDLFLEDLKRQ